MFNPDRPPPPTRHTATRIAAQEVGSPGHLRIMEYHRSAWPGYPGDKEKEWCGLFCLWALHEAGIATKVAWRNGGGFCEEQRLPRDKTPEPGDIAYYAAPFHHHAMVYAVDYDAGTFESIDGNQANDTVQHKTGIPLTKPTCFYSIEPLVKAAADTDPAPEPDDE